MEHFVHAMGDLIEEAVSERVESSPVALTHEIREAHYAWRLHVDGFCREVGLQAADPLAEVQCLASLYEAYYAELEMHLSELRTSTSV